MRSIMTALFVTASVSFFSINQTSAQNDSLVPAQAPAPQAKACASDFAYDDFDFWLGSWNVYDQVAKQFAGTNTISKEENGCLITEHWVSQSGGTGTSMNYYDPVVKRWRQVWIASAGYLIDINGKMTDGSMVLEGNIHYFTNQRSYPFRGTWTPMEDGKVRQFFEQLDPDTGNWAIWFDGLYSPKTTE